MWRVTCGVLAMGGVVIAAAFLGGCEIGYPFRGPAFDEGSSTVTLDPHRPLVVALTQGDIATGGGKGFSRELRNVLESMNAHDGLVGYSVRRQLFGSRVWTMSVWIDHQSLQKFLASPAHRAAVRDGGIPHGSVISAYIEVPAREVPLSWHRAKAVLAEASQREMTR